MISPMNISEVNNKPPHTSQPATMFIRPPILFRNKKKWAGRNGLCDQRTISGEKITAVLQARLRRVIAAKPSRTPIGVDVNMAGAKPRNRGEGTATPQKKKRRRGRPRKEKPRGKGGEGPLVVKKTGLNSGVVISTDLQAVLGTDEDMMSRTEVLTGLYRYIRENNLHVKGNRRRFICDKRLEDLFGVSGNLPVVRIIQLIAPHLTKPSELGAEYEKREQKMFEEYLLRRGALDRAKVRRLKDPRGRNSAKAQEILKAKGLGMYKKVGIAPCLRKMCGGAESMSRPQVLKSVWEYIKKEGLQHSTNRRNIVVNQELREALQITDREEIDCFHVTGYVCKLLTSLKTKEKASQTS